jgi:hypothetical protein
MAKLCLLPILFLAVSMPQAKADDPVTADIIMARVATNQDSSEKLRSQYIYQQHIQIITRRANGKVLREETADYMSSPSPTTPNEPCSSSLAATGTRASMSTSAASPCPEPTAPTET